MCRLLATSIAFLLMGSGELSAASDTAGSAVRGRQIFVRAGCYECHGYLGQGGAGAKLAPDPLPLEALITFVRGTTGEMPAYSDKVISDAELTDIHAYLASLPQPKSPDNIPLLRDLKPPQ